MNRKYSPELKAEAVRVVLETSRPVTSVAAEFGVGAESLRTWVNKQRAAETASDGALVQLHITKLTRKDARNFEQIELRATVYDPPMM